MSGNISGVFSESDNYVELATAQGQFVRNTDFNWATDISNWDMGGHSIYSTGIGLKTNHLTNAPVLKVKVNNDIGEGSVITLEMTAANAVKFKVNGGAFGAPIAVTADGSTWNVITGSGLTVIFSDSCVVADSTEIWVARGLRLLGCELEFSVGVTYTLAAGKMLLEGKYVELPLDSVNTANGDYVFIKVEEAAVDKTTDTDLGHYMYDGNYAAKGLTATQRTYDLQSAAIVPTATTVPYAKYIIVGKVTNAAGAVFDQMWDNSLDMQKIYRLYADTTPPVAPTGLTLSSIAEKRNVTMVSSLYATDLANFANLKMSCNINPEFDIDYYEFKIVRLDIVPNPTTDSLTIHVKPNKDDGGVSIPIGADYTLRSLVIGITYRVWVRAVDMAGNVGTWSASADQRIGGNCQIPVGDPAPAFTLTDTSGFVGFCVNITAVPANLDGITMWASESAYPVTANNEGFLGNYKGVIGKVQIPWKESGHPYIILQAYDENGLYHVDGVGAIVYSQDNIELAASAQLSTETHDSNISSHSGTISDCITCQQPHGSMYKWFNLLTHQAWTPEGVYVLAKSGSLYSTMSACLNAIIADNPTKATIFVMPGDYATPVAFPSTSIEISVVGFSSNVCGIGACDVSSIADVVTMDQPNLIFRNLRIWDGVTGDNTGANIKAVTFDNCYFEVTPIGGYNIDFDSTGTGSWFLRFLDCTFWADATASVKVKDDVDFIFDNCTFVSNANVLIAVYIDVPTSAVRLFKNCAIQVTGVTTGDTIKADAAGPYNIWCHACSWNQAPDATVTVQAGTVNTNTVIASNYITG